MRAFGFLTGVALATTGCAGSSFDGAGLQRGPQAFATMPATGPGADAADYRIGALDRIDVSVYQEPDLSAKNLEVNAAGRIALPLIGDVVAGGRTSAELAADIGTLYGRRYLEHPRVSVTVTQSVSQKIVIQGEVTEPGVYPVRGRATLLEAISMAKGETRVAATRQVAVFRTIDGQRTGALFDIAAIRRGEADDLELRGSDIVVVGKSGSKSLWRDVLATAPMLAVFRPLGY